MKLVDTLNIRSLIARRDSSSFLKSSLGRRLYGSFPSDSAELTCEICYTRSSRGPRVALRFKVLISNDQPME